MKSLPHGRDPLSLLEQDDEVQVKQPPKIQLMDPLGLVNSNRDQKDASNTFTVPITPMIPITETAVAEPSDLVESSFQTESARLTSQDSTSVGGHLFSDISLKSFKNRLQGTVNALQGSASAAIHEFIKPLSLNGQVATYSEELSAILNLSSYDFEVDQPLSTSDFETLVKHHPEYELMLRQNPMTSALDLWLGEETPVLLTQGIMTVSNASPLDHIGVKVFLSNMRLIITPVARVKAASPVTNRFAETINADALALNQADYTKAVTHYLMEEGLIYIIRGQITSSFVERLVLKKTDGPIDSMVDALALESESLVGACLSLHLQSDKSIRLVISTNQSELVDQIKDQVCRQFQCFDPLTFKPEFSQSPDDVSDDESLYLIGLQIFAFFDPVVCYRDWGGLIDGNANYALCESYPPFLPMGGLDISSAELAEVAKFRSRGRLPVLSYRTKSASMWRCSQPQTSVLGRRCESDEWLIRCGLHNQSGDNEKSSHCVHIYDARPFANALANKIGGAGYESTSRYVGCTVDFASIENIHRVSASFASLKEVLLKNLDIPRAETLRHTDKLVCARSVSELMPKIYQTGWFDHIHALLKASYQIANLLMGEETVLVHCSDGWDRTGQLTFLSLVFLCPFYRTIGGFCLLLEKEFSWLGHMLNLRLGLGTTAGLVPQLHGALNLNDHKVGASSKCPILLQLLECTYHILKQAPEEFEFTERFLLALAHHIYAKIWGDFAFNNHKERLHVRRSFSWRSLFRLFKDHCPSSFKRSLGSEEMLSHKNMKLIDFDLSPLQFYLWDKYWLRHCTSFF